MQRSRDGIVTVDSIGDGGRHAGLTFLLTDLQHLDFRRGISHAAIPDRPRSFGDQRDNVFGTALINRAEFIVSSLSQDGLAEIGVSA